MVTAQSKGRTIKKWTSITFGKIICVFRHEGEKCGFWHSVKNVINEGCKGFLGDPRLIHRHFLSRGAAEGQKDDELTEGRQENPCNPSEMTFLTEGPETTLCPSGEHHFFPPSAEKHSIKSFHTYWGLLMSYSVSFLSFWLFFWVFFGGGEFKKMAEFGEREDKPVEKSFSSLAYPPARQCHKGNFLTPILEAKTLFFNTQWEKIKLTSAARQA